MEAVMVAKKTEEFLIIGSELGAIGHLARRFKAAQSRLVLGAEQSRWDAEIRALEELCRQYLERGQLSR
jgi:hypothetical protein